MYLSCPFQIFTPHRKCHVLLFYSLRTLSTSRHAVDLLSFEIPLSLNGIMVADIEELGKLDASEIHARRPNAKEVVTSKKG